MDMEIHRNYHSRRGSLSLFRRAPSSTSQAGFTVIETLVAAMVILIAMGALFIVGGRSMNMITQSQNATVAAAILHERMQQLQSTPWETLTDSDSYQDQVWTDPEDGTTENVDGLMKAATQAGAPPRLESVVESLTVSAYRPTATSAPVPAPITVSRNSSAASFTGTATTLVDEKMVRIDLRLTWTDPRSRAACSRALSSVVARK